MYIDPCNIFPLCTDYCVKMIVYSYYSPEDVDVSFPKCSNKTSSFAHLFQFPSFQICQHSPFCGAAVKCWGGRTNGGFEHLPP